MRKFGEQAVFAEAHLEEERACRQQLQHLLDEERSAGRRLRESLGELTVAVRMKNAEGGGGDQATLKACLEEAMLRFAMALNDRSHDASPSGGGKIGAQETARQEDGTCAVDDVGSRTRRFGNRLQHPRCDAAASASHAQGSSSGTTLNVGSAAQQYLVEGTLSGAARGLCGAGPILDNQRSSDASGADLGLCGGSLIVSSSPRGEERTGHAVSFQDGEWKPHQQQQQSRVSPPKVHWRVREEPGGAQDANMDHHHSSTHRPIAPPPSQGASPLSLLRGSLTIVRSIASSTPGDDPSFETGPEHRRPPPAPTIKHAHVPLPGGRTAAVLRGDAQPRAADPGAGPSAQGYYIEAAGNSTLSTTISPRVLFAGRGTGMGVGVGEIFPSKAGSISDDVSVRDEYSYVSDATDA